MSDKPKAQARSHRCPSPGSTDSGGHKGSPPRTTDDLLAEMDETPTPKKGRKKKEETHNPSMELDWQKWIKPGGKDVTRPIDSIRLDDDKTLGQIRRLDPKDVEKKVRGFLQRTPSAPIHLTVWEDAGMFPLCLFRTFICPVEREFGLCCTALYCALRSLPQMVISTALPASIPSKL